MDGLLTMLAAILVIVVLVVSHHFESKKKRAEAETKAVDNFRYSKRQLKEFFKESTAFDSRLEDLLAPHLQVLARKQRQLISEDDYGNTLSDAWERELAYFVDSVLLPTGIQQRLMNLQQRYIQAEYACTTTVFASVLDTPTMDKLGITPQVVHDEFMERAMHLPVPITGLDNGEGLSLLVWDNVIKWEGSLSNQMKETMDVNALTGEGYELFCKDQLMSLGWSVIRRGGSGDQGVDLIGKLKGHTVVFQCKLYSSPVGNAAVQEVIAGMAYEGADAGAVITNSSYTKAAKQLAQVANITLLHHEGLADFTASLAPEAGQSAEVAAENQEFDDEALLHYCISELERASFHVADGTVVIGSPSYFVVQRPFGKSYVVVCFAGHECIGHHAMEQVIACQFATGERFAIVVSANDFTPNIMSRAAQERMVLIRPEEIGSVYGAGELVDEDS